MSLMSVLNSLAAIAVITSLVIWLFRRQHSSTLPLPPGPPRLPILGNVLDVVAIDAAQAYFEMGQKLGSDILHLDAMGMHLVILNSREATTDLLEKRSAIYSDRPWLTMLCELVGFGWGLSAAQYGEDWKLGRKMFQHELGPGIVEKYHRAEERETQMFLTKLVNEPERFLEHVRHLAGAIFMRVAYGIDAQADDDPYIHLAEHTLHGLSKVSTFGAYLVDIWPILKHIPGWVPGAGFKKEAAEFSKSLNTLLNTPYDELHRRMLEGETPDCAAPSLLETFGKGANTELVIKRTLAMMYIGGADTTVSTLSSFFLAMTLYPEVQTKAQHELDAVLGGQRLPKFSDQASLPYVTAIMKESLRWKPVVSLNFPHRSTQDDVYRGYHIPEGSLVCSNDWAMMHDESVYPNPSCFNPDRFMKDGGLSAEVEDPATIAFGFGRRICPGRFMAQDMLWIAIASTLATITISKEVNATGEEVMPETRNLPGFLRSDYLCPLVSKAFEKKYSHPRPFKCTIKPRPSSVALIEESS